MALVLRNWRFVATHLPTWQHDVSEFDNAMLGCENAVKFCRTSAVEYMLGVARHMDSTYHIIIANAARRRRQQCLFARKRTLVATTPEVGSSIVQATNGLREKLLVLHRNPNDLKLIDRRLFEEVVAEVFSGFGYAVELTSQTRDGGRDIVAVKSIDDISIKYLIDCKRKDPGNPIGVGLVRQLLGVLEDERATKGLLVSTTHFSKDARAFEARHRWRLELKEYERVVEWIAAYVARARGG